MTPDYREIASNDDNFIRKEDPQFLIHVRLATLEAKVAGLESTIKVYGLIVLVAALLGGPAATQILRVVTGG